jgi:hypothetical protein
MTDVNLNELIRKRHDGDAWIVVEELGNGTGYNTKRHADAVAIGLWPSRGYEIHGYEVKISRGDVQRELNDPSKADAVGKYCDFWWLVVDDLKIIDGLVIPPTWGVLYPKNRVLRIHQKAPQRKATPVSRAFSAAMIRRVCSTWVPRHEHEALKTNSLELAKTELAKEGKWKKDAAIADYERLLAAVTAFEKDAGIELLTRYTYPAGGGGGEETGAMPKSSWELKRIADAVKIVMEAREHAGSADRFRNDDPIALVQQELAGVERAIATHEQAIGNRRGAADRLRELLARIDTTKPTAPVQLSLVDDTVHVP